MTSTPKTDIERLAQANRQILEGKRRVRSLQRLVAEAAMRGETAAVARAALGEVQADLSGFLAQRAHILRVIDPPS